MRYQLPRITAINADKILFSSIKPLSVTRFVISERHQNTSRDLAIMTLGHCEQQAIWTECEALCTKFRVPNHGLG
jgi:hypothetical protein